MDAGTKQQQPGSDLPDGAPESLQDAANGKAVDAQGESDALEFLLGATFRPQYNCRVEFETPAGMRSLTFRLWALDDRELQRIDAAHRKDADSPFAKIDSTGFNAEVVSKATRWIQDGSGRKVEPDSREFVGEAIDPVLAMEVRFKYQPGLLEGLAEEIRKLSAYSRDRIGTASRVLVDAAGGS